MRGKANVHPESFQFIEDLESKDVIDYLEEASFVTVKPVSYNNIVYKNKEVENMVVVQPTTDDESDRSFLGVMDGSCVPMGGTPVTVTGIQDDLVEVESCFTTHKEEHPSVGDEIMVRIFEQHNNGSMGGTEVGIPVFIPNGKYKAGNELKITISKKTESYFVGEVVLDINQESFKIEDLDGVEIEGRGDAQRGIWDGVPIDVIPLEVTDLEPERLVVTGETTEAVEAKWDLSSAAENNVLIESGEEITFEIRDADGDSCIGFYNGYPIVCSDVHAFPTECEGEQIRGIIENVEPDKATVSLLHLPKTEEKIDIKILGLHKQSAIAVSDEYLMRLPETKFVSVDDEISVIVTSQGGKITEVSAGECIDVRVGEEITFEITEAKGDSCVGYYQGFPVVCSVSGAFPDGCESRQIKARVQEHKSDRLVVSLSHPPETEQELDVEILGLHGQDGIAVSDGYLMRLPETKFVSVGDEISVIVTSQGGKITEISAGECIDVRAGEEITFEITEAKGDSCVGYYQGFPVVCSVPGAFPDGCESRQIKARVQEHKSDRLVVSLSHLPETEQELDVEALGHYKSDIIATGSRYLVRIPAVEVVSNGDLLRVAVKSRTEKITQMSVAARNIFQSGNDDLLVRLPETTGEYTIIDDEFPVITSHLPNIKSPVTLGVSDVNTDSVVPTVTALPESHVPRVSDHMVTKRTRADEMVAIGVGEELPVELPLLSAIEADTIEIRVGEIARGRVFGVFAGDGDRDKESFHEYFIHLQLAELAYAKQDYEKVHETLVSARNQLNPDQSVLDAILTAHIPLIDLVCVTNIEEVQPREIEEERERLTDLRKRIEKSNASDEIRTYLQACDLELKAAINFIEAVNGATQESQTSLQSIARGYDSRDDVTEGVAHASRALTTAVETDFSMFVPSNELRLFVEKLRHSYPISVDELSQIPKPKQDANWLGHFVSSEYTDTFGERLRNKGKENNIEIWTRPSVPNTFGVWSADGVELTNKEATPEPGTQTEKYSLVSEEVVRETNSSGDSFGDKKASDKKSTITNKEKVEPKHSKSPDSDTPEKTENVEASPSWDGDRHETTPPSKDDSEVNTKPDSTTDAEIREGELAKPSSTNHAEAEERSKKEQELGTTQKENDDRVEIDGRNKVTPTSAPDIDVTEKLRELRRKAEQDATEDPVVQSSGNVSTKPRTRYTRSPKIRQYARTRADGVCELCDDSAPFVKPDGEPYLEVHHVNELGDGGADDPSLVVALCPTCHMEIHYGRRGTEMNDALREKLEAGLGDVGATK